MAGRREHRAPRLQDWSRRGWSSCGRSRPRRSRPRPLPFEPWNEEPAGARSVEAAVQAYRRHDQRLARQRRAAYLERPHRARRRYSDPGAAPRSLHHADDPRAEAARRAGRRRRPHEAHRSARGAGPRRARRFPADARRRSRRLPSCSKARCSASTTTICSTLAHARDRLAVVGAEGKGDRRCALRRGRRIAYALADARRISCRLTNSSPSCSAPTGSDCAARC